MDGWLAGWMTCDFMSFSNSISVISGQRAGDNERLCAMEPHLQMRRSPPQVELEPGTTRSVG